MTVIVGKRPAHCAACGGKINEHDAHMSMGTYGLAHVKEGCLTVMTRRIRKHDAAWDWNMRERIQTEGPYADDNRIPTETEGSGEVQA